MKVYIFNDHHQKRKLDTECFLGISRTLNIGGADIRAHDL